MGDPAQSWTLRVRDYKAIKQVEFSPTGVSLLAGPNGAGKSSVLKGLEFLRRALTVGIDPAMDWLGRSSSMLHLGTDSSVVAFALTLDGYKWVIFLAMEGASVHAIHGEVAAGPDGAPMLSRMPGSAQWKTPAEWPAWRNFDGRTGLRYALDRGAHDELRIFLDFFEALAIYPPLCLEPVRAPRQANLPNERLLPTAENLVYVLHNWKSAPRRHDDRFAWVLEHLRRAFPGQVEDIEFDVLHQFVEARIWLPGGKDRSIPLQLVADGVLTGLILLTAVASAPERGVVAIDELENHLHPHAIRSIIASMRELADLRDLSVILTSHSPVVMNEFRGHEDQFFVLEPGAEDTPTPLAELKDPGWLAQYALGDLYDDLEFGGPKWVAKEG